MIMQKAPAEVDKDKVDLDGDTAKVMCPFSKLQFFFFFGKKKKNSLSDMSPTQ